MHQEGEIELPVPEGIPVHWADHVMIRSRDEALPREEARRRLGLPRDAFIVYIGFGSGGDDEYEKLLQWVGAAASEFPDWLFACSAPPLYRGGSVMHAGPNVREFSYFPLAECWSAFDGAVSALGVNTTAELLHQGIPAIYVPRDLPEEDHSARAQRIADKGAGWIVEPYDTEALRRSLQTLADPREREQVSENARRMVPVNGAEHAAEYLLRWVREE